MAYAFQNSRVSTSLLEPVFTTKFLLSIILPPPLRSKYGSEYLTEQVKKIEGLDSIKTPAPVTQEYRFVKRHFVGSVVEDTGMDLEMEFEVNVDDKGIMWPFNIIADWSRIQYDQKTGFQGLKKDYSGACVIEMHKKDGTVLEKWDCPIMFLSKNINVKDLVYAEEGLYKLNVGFKVESNFEDIYYSA